MKMTDSQKNGMINFHEKAARAYAKYGKKNDSDTAKRMAKNLKADMYWSKNLKKYVTIPND